MKEKTVFYGLLSPVCEICGKEPTTHTNFDQSVSYGRKCTKKSESPKYKLPSKKVSQPEYATH